MDARIDFEAIIRAWAAKNRAVVGLVLIGSRQRPRENILEASDLHSDWDFQVITSRPEMFATSAWTRQLPGIKVHAYAVRRAQIGGVPKINIVFEGGEVDFVIIPSISARAMKLAIMLGLHLREGRLRRRIQDLVEVIRPGWRFLKGADDWDHIFKRIVSDLPDPRLTDSEACQLAEIFVSEYVWCKRKIDRGELRATQRVIYQELLEINLKLFHELKRRRGEMTFTKARRIEKIASPVELEAISVNSDISERALIACLEKCAETCRSYMAALVGPLWCWPNVC